MNEYKEECFKRFENTQKYKKYNTDELIDEIFDLHQELDQYKNNWEELKIYIEESKINISLRPYSKYAITIETILNKMKELEEDK